MTGSRPNTRRRHLNIDVAVSDIPCLPLLDTQNSHQWTTPSTRNTLPLRKSATFHSPTSPSHDDDPVLNIPRLPRRSPTCPKSLEDAVAAGEQRVARLLGVVDRSLSGLENFATETQEILKAEDLPVPRFMIDAHVGNLDNMDIDKAPDRIIHSSHLQRKVQKHHTSDSGIGSTVTGSEQSLEHPPGVCAIRSGVNGSSVSLTTSLNGSPHALSEYACRQIQKHIILPILREDSLKNFHQLVTRIPYLVGRKEITCLRDLEKILLWLAPKWSVSKASFIKFCETSIQCIHTTVDYLNEPDQRRATDKPYTNGYFLDLTEQVRQYAEMITASRECIAAGRKPPDDYNPEDRLDLHGGLGQTGHPAQLVKIRDGKSISLRTGQEILPDSIVGRRLQRSISVESDHDIQRSMARRRKAEQAAIKEHQKCRECDKLFKRPCDLTKHEKTHSRPWKCSESTCKYHQYGWPTEKERDRHVNDKHSSTPSMYKCQYHPCPYESKRESNCKQHMEKAHGWAYIRSKNNGKAGKRAQGVKAPRKTPLTPQMASPVSCNLDVDSIDFSTVSGSPDINYGYSVARSIDGSVATTEGSTPNSAPGMPFMSVDEMYRPLDPVFGMDDSLGSAGQSDHFFNTHPPSWGEAPMTNAQTVPSTLETSLTLQDQQLLFSDNFDWSNMNSDFPSYNMQLVTPASSVDTKPLDCFSRHSSVSHPNVHQFQVPSLSPGAQDVMLYSPYSNDDACRDEGYDDFASDTGKPDNDFALFDGSSRSEFTGGYRDKGHMFQDLATLGPSVWSGRGTDLAQQLGMNELMQVDEE